MRIAFVFPPMLVGGRPVDFGHVWGSPRGLTGSETQLLCVAKEMAARGHDCSLFIEDPNAESWEKVQIKDLRGVAECHGAMFGRSISNSAEPLYEIVVSALDCNVLKHVPKPDNGGPLRVCFQQCNDFRYGESGWRDWTDLIVLPSHAHRRMFVDPTVRPALAGLGGWLPAKKVAVVPNGCYPEEYGSAREVIDRQRIRGKCVYISSPDRGLHIALQEWPAIRRAVPWATLDVYYYSLESFRAMYRGQKEDSNWNAEWKEWLRRSQYIDQGLDALAGHGVRAIGPVGRTALVEVMKQAEVLAYSCDVISWTESFSCATLEGCASGALPIISEIDCLGEVYGAAVPTVREVRSKEGAAGWRELVIKTLTDRPWADEHRRKARALAETMTWRDVAEKMEKVFEERLEERSAQQTVAVREQASGDTSAAG